MSLIPGPRLLSVIYGRAASWRRAWYLRHPTSRRRLEQPVLSVGNLVVGGSGKTPVVAALARWLVEEGERPAILTRGYGRRERTEGVLVVSDGGALLEPVRRSGDEPQMLARSVAGVPVLVCADRHLAGTLAERQLGCTVHLLDDGFQHLTLARDVDLLVAAEADLQEHVMPAGRLREPIAAAHAADVLLVPGEEDDVERVASALGVRPCYRVRAVAERPRRLVPFGMPLPPMAGGRAVAVAGIARPERFFRTVREQGWEVVKELAFGDHHWFTTREIDAVVAAARASNADVILTTGKDAARLLDLPLGVSSPPLAFIPITAAIEPAASFEAWLRDRLRTARARERQVA